MAHFRLGAAVWLCVVAVVPFATTSFTHTTGIVPAIPQSQEQSPLIELWRTALKYQETKIGPKTFLAPRPSVFKNWVPPELFQHRNAHILREVLMDYMVEERVSANDKRMREPNGLRVINLNGKPLVFRRNGATITVNGVQVVSAISNKDHTVSYYLQGDLFGHRGLMSQLRHQRSDLTF
ncbi:uncharacterized protein LOC135110533 [Scylla paramamosain]